MTLTCHRPNIWPIGEAVVDGIDAYRAQRAFGDVISWRAERPFGRSGQLLIAIKVHFIVGLAGLLLLFQILGDVGICLSFWLFDRWTCAP